MDIGTQSIPITQSVDGQPDRGHLLAAISNSIVGLHKRFYGKGPTKARSYYLDDMVVCVLRGGMTRAEMTLASTGRGDVVTRQRQELQAAIQDEFVETVEALVGRKVVACMSNASTEPDLSVEIFILEPDGAGH